MQSKTIKKLAGVAVSDSRHKTVKVEVTRLKIHPIYQKRFFQRRKFIVHTEKEIKKGQSVVITPSRPRSKLKHWQVVE